MVQPLDYHTPKSAKISNLPTHKLHTYALNIINCIITVIILWSVASVEHAAALACTFPVVVVALSEPAQESLTH